MLSDSLGTAQHLSPGEVLAEKCKAEHWHCCPGGPDIWGCVSIGGPQPAGEATIKPSILCPVSCSLELSHGPQ